MIARNKENANHICCRLDEQDNIVEFHELCISKVMKKSWEVRVEVTNECCVTHSLNTLDLKQTHVCVVPDRRIDVSQVNDTPQIIPKPDGCSSV